MSEWLAMGGHGFFIWSSYGMLALALVIEIAVLRRVRRGAIERARALRADANLS
jgi:heme exporter protein D